MLQSMSFAQLFLTKKNISVALNVISIHSIYNQFMQKDEICMVNVKHKLTYKKYVTKI